MDTLDQSLADRLRDLIATGEKQYARRSFDAAVDTFRAALAALPADSSGELREVLEWCLSAAECARSTTRSGLRMLAGARYDPTAGRLEARVGEAPPKEVPAPVSVAPAAVADETRVRLPVPVRPPSFSPFENDDAPPAGETLKSAAIILASLALALAIIWVAGAVHQPVSLDTPPWS